MRAKLIKLERVGGAFLILVLFSVAALAAGNVRISDSDNNYRIIGHDNNPITPSMNDNLEFFYGGVPTDPRSSANRITPIVSTQTGYKNYYFDASGTGISVRAWFNKTGNPDLRGSYYGISNAGNNILNNLVSGSLQAASDNATPSQWWLKAFTTDYLADIPQNAPTWGNASESSQRLGDTLNVRLSLSIGFSYNEGNPKIQATGYLLRFWKTGEADPGDNVAAPDNVRVFNLNGNSFSLPATDALTGQPFGSGTYNFKVRAYNWYGQGPWSTVKSWPTLAGGTGGGAASFTYVLTPSLGDKLIVNSITVPSLNLTRPAAATIAKVSDLAKVINDAAGAIVVTAIYKWERTGEPRGVVFDASGGVVAGGDDFIPTPGEGIQVYTNKEITITLEGK